MFLHVHSSSNGASAAAADCLADWLGDPTVRNVMVAGGNTPLDLYRLIAERRLDLSRLSVFALDEYVGVPPEEPRNCANLIRRTVVEPWGVAPERYFSVSSLATDALDSVLRQEQRIGRLGGLDVIVLGLGQNGHLGFNEPGSGPDSTARVLDLDPVSTEANGAWFNGDHRPSRGVTLGLKTILAARRILILAYGAHKIAAVTAMVEGPASDRCPASFLEGHPRVHVFLDETAASRVTAKRRIQPTVTNTQERQGR